MTLSRKDRLQTLGLWPMWRLRVHAPVDVEPAVEKELPEKPQSPEPTEPLHTSENTALAASKPEPKSEPVSEPEPLRVSASLDASEIKTLEWDTLNAAIQSCTRCALTKTRTRAVPGVGDIHADWLFIGEAPGANEDRLGEPFVGDAGQLLDAMMAAIGLRRGDNVFIANVLKSRPPGNRDPQPEEIAACRPYLERQIELIQPKLIVALGRFAAQNLLSTDTPIGILRGQVHRYRGLPLVVTYHPAYLLRNPIDKAKVWEDLVLARRTMNELKSHSVTQ